MKKKSPEAALYCRRLSASVISHFGGTFGLQTRGLTERKGQK
jgi:hypothetical protein